MVQTILIAAGPAIAAIAGCILAYFKNKKVSDNVVNQFNNIKNEIVSMKEYTEVKEQLKIAHQENYELKCKLDTLITQLTKVQSSTNKNKGE